MDTRHYQQFTEQLLQNIQADPQVLGLVALGSMANHARLDQWSDHDFFLIVTNGSQEGYRQNLAWLPDVDQIVLQFRETEHGLKVLYRSGHLIEFAVFDPDELMIAKGNDYAVLLDKTDIQTRMTTIIDHSTPPPIDAHHELVYFLSLLQVAASRYARGEVLSGHIFVKAYALGHLLRCLIGLKQPESPILDNLDPYRRFEKAFPDWGVKINQALLLNPLHCALALLDFADSEIQPLITDYPQVAADTIRNYLRRPDAV